MEYVVTTKELTKRFGGFTAVDRLSINIGQGDIYGFLGPNGAGKSTAIRMLCGILDPTSGSGTVLGYDLAREVEKYRQEIGYMSQKFSLYNDLTVRENLDFYASMYGVPARDRQGRIGEMLDMAQLAGRERELVANLSGGWKQRLALGCAIIHRPRLVFLDEPTSGVSPTSRRMFFKIIHQLVSEGTTVMVTTHFMDEAERCHQIAFISGGRLIAVDSPDSLKRNSIKGCMAELSLPDALGRMSDVVRLPFVKECTMHGPVLHVLLDNDGDLQALREFAGVDPVPITPSLEDVFIALAKQQRGERQNEPATGHCS